MKKKALLEIGLIDGPAIDVALSACAGAGLKHGELRAALARVVADPDSMVGDPMFGAVALAQSQAARARQALMGAAEVENDRAIGYACWGDEIDEAAHDQMRAACRLPVAHSAALMPDAHVGYGLPIGGVLATRDAVIPYAVGVDIACRMMMTVFDAPVESLSRDADRLERILSRETMFGVGQTWKPGSRPLHDVMDEDWNVTPVTAALKDKAWSQLGTSGSGNHFVEWGELEVFSPEETGRAEARADLPPPGRYLAVLSHSGSRGPGAKVADHYSKLAASLHPNLHGQMKNLAWLPLSGGMSSAGREYWAAMELMGKYASANHHVIHRKVARALGGQVLLQVENHHNFAWRETHGGHEVIVHRKGATPAGAGVLGLIPGSMATPGYLVEGLGHAPSLNSASHGAGRKMSRTKARETIRWKQVHELLEERNVRLMSAGLDESPHSYKDIESVLEAQRELVRRLARFSPRIVRMAPEGERPED